MNYCERNESEDRLYTLTKIAALETLAAYYELKDAIRKAGFDPNQPRVPAGNPDGGQWTDGGSGNGTENDVGGGGGRFESLPRSETNPGNGTSRNLTGVDPKTYTDTDGRVKSVPKGWARPEKFSRHFKDHGHKVGAESGEDYFNKTQEFRKQGIKEKFPTIQNKHGWTKIYDPKTKSFGVYDPKGKTETYYPLEGGDKAFQRQINSTVKDGGKVINPLRGSGGGRGPGFIDPKDPFDEFPDDNLLKYIDIEHLIERKYFATTEDCGNY